MPEAHNYPQFVQGRDRLALVVRLLLEQNGLSHSDMQAFFRWCCSDTPTWFNRSQISTIRNSKLPKPGPQIFLGIAEINLRLAQLAGDDSPMVQELEPRGPLPADLKHLANPDHKPFYVVNPKTGFPMDEGDLFKLFCGRIEMDGERWEKMPAVYDDDEASQISGQMAVWAQRWMAKRNLIPLEGRSELLKAYPPTDPKRIERLWNVVLGQSRWKGRELRDEADALRFMVGTMERGSAYSIREFDRWCRGQEV